MKYAVGFVLLVVLALFLVFNQASEDPVVQRKEKKQRTTSKSVAAAPITPEKIPIAKEEIARDTKEALDPECRKQFAAILNNPVLLLDPSEAPNASVRLRNVVETAVSEGLQYRCQLPPPVPELSSIAADFQSACWDFKAGFESEGKANQESLAAQCYFKSLEYRAAISRYQLKGIPIAQVKNKALLKNQLLPVRFGWTTDQDPKVLGQIAERAFHLDESDKEAAQMAVEGYYFDLQRSDAPSIEKQERLSQMLEKYKTRFPQDSFLNEVQLNQSRQDDNEQFRELASTAAQSNEQKKRILGLYYLAWEAHGRGDRSEATNKVKQILTLDPMHRRAFHALTQLEQTSDLATPIFTPFRAPSPFSQSK